MASTQLPCPSCSNTFSKEAELLRHSKESHPVSLQCPFPDKACDKVYTKYSAMLNHLQNDVQDHRGMGLDEIHRLAASHADEEAIDAPTPKKWILWMYRSARRARLGKPRRSYSLRNKRRENDEDDQVDNINKNDAAVIAKPDLTHQATEELVDGDLMDIADAGYGGYESEPEEWWKRWRGLGRTVIIISGETIYLGAVPMWTALVLDVIDFLCKSFWQRQKTFTNW